MAENGKCLKLISLFGTQVERRSCGTDPERYQNSGRNQVRNGVSLKNTILFWVDAKTISYYRDDEETLEKLAENHEHPVTQEGVQKFHAQKIMQTNFFRSLQTNQIVTGNGLVKEKFLCCSTTKKDYIDQLTFFQIRQWKWRVR